MNREAIYAGLFAQLSAIPGFNTKSRLLRHWTDVIPEKQPALFQAQVKEIAVTPGNGLPTKWELNLQIYVYVKTNGEDPPSQVMNPLVDAITNIINARHVISGKNTLGSLPGVEWARVDGTIESDEGVLGNQAVAIIPVSILVTDQT